ncbi:MAG: hypothetical protein JJU20_09680 [Opitutales bacterium]|nr:hypothetical protein [Opitutales bacterium]
MKHLKLIPALTLATAALLAGPIQLTAADSESVERPQVRAQSERGPAKAETSQRGQRQRLQQCAVPCCENRQVQRQEMRERRQRQSADGRRQGSRGEGKGPRS